MTSRINKGRLGEDTAVRYLKTRGNKVLFRNWTCRWGEIDAVCFAPADRLVRPRLVFVEVKYTTGKNIYAVDQFTKKKKESLRRSINLFFAKEKKFELFEKVGLWQLDLVCVRKKATKRASFWVSHYENVLSDSF